MRGKQIAALFTRLCFYFIVVFSLWTIPATNIFIYYVSIAASVLAVVCTVLNVLRVVAGDWDLWRDDGAWSFWNKLDVSTLVLYIVIDVTYHIYWAAVLGILCLAVVGLMYPVELTRTPFEEPTLSIHRNVQTRYIKRVK